MDTNKINIMTRAVSILVSRGIPIDDALAKYPNLTEAEIAVIRDRVSS